MTKKKTPTRLKKIETKKAPAKGYTNGNTTVEFGVSVDVLRKLTEENECLKRDLSFLKNIGMPKEEFKQFVTNADHLVRIPSATPVLDVILSDMDKNLCRFYNAMNTLDSFADRLKPSDQAQMPIGPAPLPPSYIIGRMERLLSDFNHLNNRLEATNNYLSEIV